MSINLSLAELDELIDLSNLNFTLHKQPYQTNLLDLPINPAITWLEYQVRSSKKQLDKSQKLNRWVNLSLKYQRTISLFYPNYITRSKTYTKELIESNYLVTHNLEDLKDYWLTCLANLNYTQLTPRVLVEYSRIYLKLQLVLVEDPLRFKDFSRVFDLEMLYGYSPYQLDTFFILFSYLSEASKNPNWGYSKYEWPLLRQSLSIWQTWSICSQVTIEKTIYLLNKYCNIATIHPAFIHWIWDKPNPALKIESKWYQETEGFYCPQDNLIDDAFKIIGISPDVNLATAKVAYKDLIKQYHPDINPLGLHRAQEINNAWAQIKRYYNQRENYYDATKD